MMSANGIDHRLPAAWPPPVRHDRAVSALPYVQGVYLNPNRLLIVPRAEHPGGAP